ncbi:MAG: hypothetical protein CEE38_11800 [Planctomycetes bacterium B3_Pla]|nr:MAG: hypothetical protein CEE38_11800 [Planctomycetes bacterium B3_Pla]
MTKAFTWGTFSLIHDGHKEFLQSIKSICDEIHIILIPEIEVFRNKNYIPADWSTRRTNLQKLGLASHIHYDSYNLGLKSLLQFKPDFFVIGYDQKTVWEERLVSFLVDNDLNTKMVYSKEFAQGIHCAQFRESGQSPLCTSKLTTQHVVTTGNASDSHPIFLGANL